MNKHQLPNVIGQEIQIKQIYQALTRESCLLPNVSLIKGQTGSGKSYLTELIIKDLGLIPIIIDATYLTAKGWSEGNHLDNEILNQVNKLPRDTVVQDVVIVIDEFDKIGKAQYGANGSNHVLGIQQNFLKLIDGIIIKPTAYIKTDIQEIDTGGLKWLLLGAFSDLDDTIERSIGFNGTTNQKDLTYMKQRLVKYGFMPELIGRILTVVELDYVNDKMFKDYLMDKNNLFNTQLDKWRKLYQDLPEPNYAAILTEANAAKLGMRGLLSACQSELDRLDNWIQDNVESKYISRKR